MFLRFNYLNELRICPFLAAFIVWFIVHLQMITFRAVYVFSEIHGNVKCNYYGFVLLYFAAPNIWHHSTIPCQSWELQMTYLWLLLLLSQSGMIATRPLNLRHAKVFLFSYLNNLSDIHSPLDTFFGRWRQWPQHYLCHYDRVRFEFLEIIIRASFGKYIAPRILDDSSDSVQKLLDDEIVPHAPPEARINPNDFRRDRFYTREMDATIKLNWDLLVATFKLYKAKDKTKYFWIEHWISLLESASICGSHTGMEKATQEKLTRHQIPHFLKGRFVEGDMTMTSELK